jgi:RND family efflux transporter MFP subunit
MKGTTRMDEEELPVDRQGWSTLPLAFLAVPVMLLAISCGNKADAIGPSATNATNSDVTVVPVVTVSKTNLASNLVLTGEFIPYQEIDVMAKEAGYIKSIRVDIGDRVKAGQLLAELEIPEMQDDMQRAAANVQASEADISTAKGNLRRAQSSHDIAELSYQRVLDVSRKEAGLIPQQEVDVAHSKELETGAQVVAAQANLQTSQRKLAMAKAEQNRYATLQKYTIISAPFAGVVTKRYANTGAMIQQGTSSDTQAMPVVRLSQNDLLRLIVPLPESSVGSIRVGSAVDVTVATLGRTFPGRVTRSEGKLALNTRTLNTEIDVPNRDYTLLPGMYAQVNLHTKQSKEVLAVPVEALEDLNGTPHVYAVRNSKIQVVPVTTGIKTAEQEEIRSGLAERDVVIVGRHTGLQDGQVVKARDMSATAVAGS